MRLSRAAQATDVRLAVQVTSVPSTNDCESLRLRL